MKLVLLIASAMTAILMAIHILYERYRLKQLNEYADELENEISVLKETPKVEVLLDDTAKPLVVVPQIVADAIESIPDYYSAYDAIKLIDTKLKEFTFENEDWKHVHDWIFVDDNANKFVKAWIDGYTVEKEQLYEIRLPLPKGNYASVDFKGYIWEEVIPNKYKLTESEVKNIDERYWAFAVPV